MLKNDEPKGNMGRCKYFRGWCILGPLIVRVIDR